MLLEKKMKLKELQKPIVKVISKNNKLKRYQLFYKKNKKRPNANFFNLF